MSSPLAGRLRTRDESAPSKVPAALPPGRSASGELIKRPLQCQYHHSGPEYRRIRTYGRVPAYLSLHAESARLTGHPMPLALWPTELQRMALAGFDPASPTHRGAPR